ncbi:MAG: hypothetical protein J6S67_21325 [Methanobrevibacter sp.]|nr:hypothetical protein [Methanobrevibacter sp.]MCR5284875.1 hypothetical protein [Treponema sp.]
MASDYDEVFAPLEEGFSELTEKCDKMMTDCFRRVFSSPDGRIVLEQILTDLCFYRECKTEKENVLNNYAKFMIFNRLRINNKRQITSMLMDLNSKEN